MPSPLANTPQSSLRAESVVMRSSTLIVSNAYFSPGRCDANVIAYADSLKRPPGRMVPYDSVVRDRDAPDATLFADFLRHIFVLNPDGRANCRDLLTHPWLNP